MLNLTITPEMKAYSEKANQAIMNQRKLSAEEFTLQAQTMLGRIPSEQKQSNTPAQQIQQEAVDWLLTAPGV
jgi:ABC-type hemin transport system ATPase subunit